MSFNSAISQLQQCLLFKAKEPMKSSLLSSSTSVTAFYMDTEQEHLSTEFGVLSLQMQITVYIIADAEKAYCLFEEFIDCFTSFTSCFVILRRHTYPILVLS